MASKTKVEMEWNDAGFGAILNSKELDAFVYAQAQNIARKAGPGYKAEHWKSKAIGKSKFDRVAAIVEPETAAAARAEAKDKKLQKAVGGC